MTAGPGERVAAIIVAAGSSQRLGYDKIWASVLGRPLLAHTVVAFELSPEMDDIILVVAQERVEEARQGIGRWGWGKVREVCPGGARRQDSVAAGLALVQGASWVVVHDGARPCVTPEVLSRGLLAARETGAAVAGVPVTDTIKRVGPGKEVAATPDRRELWSVQTPQVFRYEMLRRAYGEADPSQETTDDAALVERLGYRVTVFWGAYSNIKVTTPQDLTVVEALLRPPSHAAAI